MYNYVHCNEAQKAHRVNFFFDKRFFSILIGFTTAFVITTDATGRRFSRALARLYAWCVPGGSDSQNTKPFSQLAILFSQQARVLFKSVASFGTLSYYMYNNSARYVLTYHCARHHVLHQCYSSHMNQCCCNYKNYGISIIFKLQPVGFPKVEEVQQFRKYSVIVHEMPEIEKIESWVLRITLYPSYIIYIAHTIAFLG